ncbi:hypothetical protein HK098_006962 [Nowakowskiella sp. JEL0407]|nr:hypothetical protein HK098_006962 [Nowakowskiella sp. JEL0407]
MYATRFLAVFLLCFIMIFSNVVLAAPIPQDNTVKPVSQTTTDGDASFSDGPATQGPQINPDLVPKPDAEPVVMKASDTKGDDAIAASSD